MCWERVEEFSCLNIRDGRVVLIGSASPAQLLEMKTETGFHGQVYSDPAARLYRLFGAKRGVIRTFTWKRGLENFKGFLDFGRQGLCKCRWPMLNAGDPWLQGGVAIVSKRTNLGGGKLWFHEMETSPGYPRHDLHQIQSIAERIAIGGKSLQEFSTVVFQIPIIGKQRSEETIKKGNGQAILFAMLLLAVQCYISYIVQKL